METRELICINCPLGCSLTVTMENGAVKKVEGNTCKKGEAYGTKEVTNPTRIVTSSCLLYTSRQLRKRQGLRKRRVKRPE